MTDDVIPILVVRLDRGFRDLRLQHRQNICRFLGELARGCDVRVIGTGIELRWLLANHRTNLPVSVDKSSITPLGKSVNPPIDYDAILALDPEGPQIRLLRKLSKEVSGTLTYDNIVRKLNRERSTIRYHVTQKLVPAGIVERVDHYGDPAVRLTHAGWTFLENEYPETAQPRRLEGDTDDSVDEPGHGYDEPVLPTPELEGKGKGPSYRTEFLSWPAHHAAAGSGVAGDVTLVDHPVEDDMVTGGRGWSYDADRDELVVVAEYVNPLQWWTSIAFALMGRPQNESQEWLTFEHVLDVDRLDALMADIPKSILRDARQLGYLGANVETGEEYAGELQAWANNLANLTRRLAQDDYDDRARFRGEITRDALGLAGTMVHLLDAAGVDVVRELRLPEFTRNFDAGRRTDLVKTVVMGISIQSKYREFASYRQLIEPREQKRRTAYSPRVDATDPVGEVIGSFVLVGPGVDGIQDRLSNELDTLKVHEEAPEFVVPVNIATPTRPTYASVATRLLRWKGMRPTRLAIDTLRAITGSPYDVAEALAALSKEEYRDVRLDEVRFAMATLPRDRILVDAYQSIQAMFHALLNADRPLSKSELAEQADVSTRSVRRHADRLTALDLVRSTNAGLRLSMPFRTPEERYANVRPWYTVANRERNDYEDATLPGVIWAAVENLDEPPDPRGSGLKRPAYLAGIGDIEGIRQVWPWVTGLLDSLAALAKHEVEAETVTSVILGKSNQQCSLPMAKKSPPLSANLPQLTGSQS